jgi:hypothetical protein
MSLVYKNANFYYSDPRHTNLQKLNSAMPSGAQVHYIRLAFQATSPKTSGSHLVLVVFETLNYKTQSIGRGGGGVRKTKR